MVDFDWISKAVIGVLGTTMSLMLENFSLILSVCAALLTIIYMYLQIRLAIIKKKDLTSEYYHNKEERRYQRERREIN